MRGNGDNTKETTNKIINKPLDESAQINSSKGPKETNGISQRTPKKDTHLNTQRCETSMESLLTTGKEPKP